MKKINQTFLTLSSCAFLAASLTGCKTSPSFKVTFKDYDGNVIYETTVNRGGTATFEGDLPTKPADLEKCYPFKSWDKPLENITSDLVLNPTFGEEYNISDYLFVDDCRVFQNAEVFDENTTSYVDFLKMMGFTVYLKEEAEKDGKMVDYVFLDYDDEAVKFDYSTVDTSKEGDYPFTVSVRGLVKEFTIKVVADTSKWTHIRDATAGYNTYDPTLIGKVDAFKLYEDNKCIIKSTMYDEFYPLTYEMIDDNKTLIVRSEDGSIDCKYACNELVDYYEITGVMHYAIGTHFDFVRVYTESEFTDVTSGYAFIYAGLEGNPYYLTIKYEYNPETKAMKLFAPIEFNSLTYNSESGELECVK